MAACLSCLSSRTLRGAVSIACLAAAPFALAQQPAPAQSDPPSHEHREPGHAIEEIVVTASPLGRSAGQLAQPVSVLGGDELMLESSATLGETVGSLPGTSSTWFGPGASRPIIRGLDADHIRVLANGTGTIDASGASADHAVSLDPLAVERIEVLRGPAALRYGPTGVGGVVNVIDNRVPDERLDRLASGRVEGSLDSMGRGRAGAFVYEGGAGGVQAHVDGFARRARDIDIPDKARSSRLRQQEPLPPGEREIENRLPNSAVRAEGGALGLSYAGERGFIGVAPSAYDSNYGTVKEPDVTIDLRQRRWDLAAGLDAPVAGVENVRATLGLADYQHVEFEGAEQGSVFKNRGYEGRIEALHRKLGPLEGAIGVQLGSSEFSAEGEEAFLPASRTTHYAGFAFEELRRGAAAFLFGARLDWQDVDAEGDPDFGPSRSRSRRSFSGSIGTTYDFSACTVALSAAYTERAPTAQELFADGPHIATDAFEQGDASLGLERSLGADLSLRVDEGFATGSVGLFYNHSDDFIALLPTGEVDADSGLDVFRYSQLPASFVGGEAELTLHLVDTAAQQLHLRIRGDYTRARDRHSGDPLPRIPPLRFGADLAYHGAGFHATLGVWRVAEQNRVADLELETDGYTTLDASALYELPLGASLLELFVVGSNLTNQSARNHASFLKDVAPLPGRGVRGGVRLSF